MGFSQQELAYAIYYLDVCVNSNSIPLEVLQSCAIAALLVSGKTLGNRETTSPLFFTNTCLRACKTADDFPLVQKLVLKCEYLILNSLSFNTFVPTTWDFVILYLSELSLFYDQEIIGQAYNMIEDKLLLNYKGKYIFIDCLD